MAEPASVRAWTDEEILDVFESADAVYARDGAARGTALPPMLATRPAGPLLATWADQVSLLHPDDRLAAVQLWWESVQHGGEFRRLEVRSRVGNGWRLIELSSLNLLHQPGVRAVLLGTTDLGPIEVRDVRKTTPRHVAPAWTYQEVDPVGVVQRTEGDAAAVFGHDADELTTTNMVDLLHPDDRDAAVTMWIDVMASPGSARVMQLRTVHPDGSVRWIESTVTNRLDASQEAALRASQEEFRTLAEEVPIAVFRADREGRITFGNGRWFQLSSHIGVVEFLVDVVAVDHRMDWRDRWAAFTSADDTETVTLEYPTPDHRRLFSVHCRRVHAQASEPSFIGVLSDVTDEAELRHRADHDSLTGLLNREAFDRLLHDTLVSERDAVVAFIDLDGFKQINDALGHEAGDHVLVQVGRRLTECVRPGDAVGRYGGDEFVVLCADLPTAGEDSLRKRITHALAAPVVWEGGEWPLHASIGSVRAEKGEDVVSIIRRADHAMYDDKRIRRSL
jgi:diguanylate cyclase (GGDEF)-like protein/PAS domain S-box-containing protein